MLTRFVGAAPAPGRNGGNYGCRHRNDVPTAPYGVGVDRYSLECTTQSLVGVYEGAGRRVKNGRRRSIRKPASFAFPVLLSDSELS